jgi:hypothetical protein
MTSSNFLKLNNYDKYISFNQHFIIIEKAESAMNEIRSSRPIEEVVF